MQKTAYVVRISGCSSDVCSSDLIGDPAALAVKLHEMMPQQSVSDYRRLLAADKNFIYLNRRAVPELVAAVNALGEPAIVFDREPERLYPQTDLAAHILGWTDYDGQGVAGMERVLNERLSDPDLRGDSIALSIDSRVQEIGRASCREGLCQYV